MGKTLILDATNKSITCVMSGAPATTNPDFTAHYADDTGQTLTPGENDGTLNGTTPVTLVSSPAASTRRIIRTITIQNRDTAAVTLIVRLVSGANTRQTWTPTLQIGDTWTPDGIIDSNGAIKTSTAGTTFSAPVILEVPNGSFPSGFALSTLTTGLLKNTTTTGVPSIAVAGTDYTSPTGTESLSNKTIGNTNTVTLKDTLFTLQDNSDTSKQVVFELSGITTATTRTLTVPDASGTIALTSTTYSAPVILEVPNATFPSGFALSTLATGLLKNTTTTGVPSIAVAGTDYTSPTGTESLSNKTIGNTNTVTLKDTLFTLQDDGDTSKQIVFELSGITTATTRTLTAPNASGTIALTTDLAGYVILVPATSGRNLIQNTGVDVVPLTVKRGASGHVSDLFDALDDAGTALFRVTSAGGVISVVNSTDPVANFAGAVLSTTFALTADNTFALRAMTLTTTINGASWKTSSVVQSLVSTLTIASGSTFPDVRGTDSLVRNTGTATVTQMAAYYIRSITNTGGGVITSAAGLWIEAQSSATNSYCIYTEGGPASFGESTGGIVQLRRIDTTITANDSMGTLKWVGKDTQQSTNTEFANIEVLSQATITTDQAPGIMILRTNAGTSLNQAVRIQQQQRVVVGTSTTFTGRFNIVGLDDIVQEYVVANATQTSDLAQWLNSTPTALVSISGIGVTTVRPLNADTAVTLDSLVVGHSTSGTPAANYGTTILMTAQSSTTVGRSIVRLRGYWTTATDASRKATAVLSAYDTAERDAIGWGANGSVALVGFYGIATAPIVQPANTVAIDDVLSTLGLWATGATVSKFTNNVGIKHAIGQTSAPAIAAGTGAGTSPTVSVSNATDLSGLVNVTSGALPAAASIVVTITFNVAYGVAPNVVITPGNAATALLSGATMVYTTSTTTTFVINAGATGLVAATAYVWAYHVIQ